MQGILEQSNKKRADHPGRFRNQQTGHVKLPQVPFICRDQTAGFHFWRSLNQVIKSRVGPDRDAVPIFTGLS
jgi:hypothetical protein